MKKPTYVRNLINVILISYAKHTLLKLVRILPAQLLYFVQEFNSPGIDESDSQPSIDDDSIDLNLECK